MTATCTRTLTSRVSPTAFFILCPRSVVVAIRRVVDRVESRPRRFQGRAPEGELWPLEPANIRRQWQQLAGGRLRVTGRVRVGRLIVFGNSAELL